MFKGNNDMNEMNQINWGMFFLNLGGSKGVLNEKVFCKRVFIVAPK